MLLSITLLLFILSTSYDVARAQDLVYKLRTELVTYGDSDFGLNSNKNYMHINFTVEADNYEFMKAFSAAPSIPQYILQPTSLSNASRFR